MKSFAGDNSLAVVTLSAVLNFWFSIIAVGEPPRLAVPDNSLDSTAATGAPFYERLETAPFISYFIFFSRNHINRLFTVSLRTKIYRSVFTLHITDDE